MGCGCFLVQPFMRPHGVVLYAKSIEGLLLSDTGPSDRPDRLALEGPVHPLVRAVLLWLARMNTLVLDAEAHPPNIEI